VTHLLLQMKLKPEEGFAICSWADLTFSQLHVMIYTA
jgi:hypothetical protein